VSDAAKAIVGACSVSDDIRENIVCYRDEAGEDDVRNYDMLALRIQMSHVGGNRESEDKCSVKFGEPLHHSR